MIGTPDGGAQHEQEAAAQAIRERGRELRSLGQAIVGGDDGAFVGGHDAKPSRDGAEAAARLVAVALRVVDGLGKEPRAVHGGVGARSDPDDAERSAVRRSRGLPATSARREHRGDHQQRKLSRCAHGL